MTPTIGTIYSRGLSLTPAIGMVIAAVLVDPGHMVVFSRGFYIKNEKKVNGDSKLASLLRYSSSRSSVFTFGRDSM